LIAGEFGNNLSCIGVDQIQAGEDARHLKVAGIGAGPSSQSSSNRSRRYILGLCLSKEECRQGSSSSEEQFHETKLMRNVCAERNDLLFVNDEVLVSKAERTEVLHGRSHDNLFIVALNEIGQCYLNKAVKIDHMPFPPRQSHRLQLFG
jgi:hypothetical protein